MRLRGNAAALAAAAIFGLAGCGGSSHRARATNATATSQHAGHATEPPSGPATTSDVMSVRFCGPYAPNGQPVWKGCAVRRISEELYFGAPSEFLSRERPVGMPVGSGRLTGFVAVCGDPSRESSPLPAIGICGLQLGRVQVTDTRGFVIAHEQLDKHGRFTLTLPAGRYLLTTWNLGNGPWTQRVNVVATKTTIADVVIEAI